MPWGRLKQRRDLREQVVAAARDMHRRGLVTGTVGNVSARVGDAVLITPTRREYGRLRARDIVELALDGTRCRNGSGDPSIEWPLHAAIYRARADVGAIVHTHSPYATARSFDPAPIVVQTEERTYLDLVEIPVARPQPAASEALASEVVATLGRRPAVLLARHGVVAVAATPSAALEMCATVEQQAQIEWLLRVRRQRERPLLSEPRLRSRHD